MVYVLFFKKQVSWEANGQILVCLFKETKSALPRTKNSKENAGFRGMLAIGGGLETRKYVFNFFPREV